MRMRRSTVAALACGAALLLGLALAGCGPNGGDDDEGLDSGSKGSKKAKPVPAKTEAGKDTVLKGRVTLKGGPPNVDSDDEGLRKSIRDKNLTSECITSVPEKDKDQVGQQNWKVSADGGVGNVVVWLRPPPGYYFKI